MNIQKILISGCLIGLKVRYHGGDALCNNHIIEQWKKDVRIVAICSEVSAGLPVPRPSSEIVNGTAKDIFAGKAAVITHTGIERTDAFVNGAFKALALAKKFDIKIAVLKKDSPSCGNAMIYDGSFSGKMIPGLGVTAQLLSDNGIMVFNELQLEEANIYVQLLDKGSTL